MQGVKNHEQTTLYPQYYRHVDYSHHALVSSLSRDVFARNRDTQRLCLHSQPANILGKRGEHRGYESAFIPDRNCRGPAGDFATVL